MKKVSLMFLRQGDRILLAMKKRGFGEGKWNGTGGKQEPGESIEQTAIRETQEEIGVTPLHPKLVGRVRFFLTEDPSFEHYCHMFVAHEWRGEPTETDEMRPQWFDVTAIPYGDMWADDRIWMPYLLKGQLFAGTATLDGDQIITEDISRVEQLSEEEE